MSDKIDGLVLFSGGLDSLLAALLLKNQGLNILGVHFFSPFFGNPDTSLWMRLYDLKIQAVDISGQFIDMLLNWPEHGPGKTLNPCIDCKILMLKNAKRLLEEIGASFIATGDVLGQRPMSQRVESMNIIQKKTNLGGLLLRPLCAPFLQPTIAEETGLVKRDILPRISGRGRNPQLEMAAGMGIRDIPSPGGGCKLTEKENARRYWPLLQKYWLAEKYPASASMINDFKLTHSGRILFQTNGSAWLCTSRNRQNNEQLKVLCREGDILLQPAFPGPLGLLRMSQGNLETLHQAASILLSHTPRARNLTEPVAVRAISGRQTTVIHCRPGTFANWSLPSWEDIHASIKQERKKHTRI